MPLHRSIEKRNSIYHYISWPTLCMHISNVCVLIALTWHLTVALISLIKAFENSVNLLAIQISLSTLPLHSPNPFLPWVSYCFLFMLMFFCDLDNMSHTRDKLEPLVQLTPPPGGACWKEASLRPGSVLPWPLKGEARSWGLCLPVRSLGP